MTRRIGISTGSCQGSILDVLPVLESHGIRGVELSTSPGHFDPSREDQVAALEQYFTSTALTPVSIHAPFGPSLDLADEDASRRHLAVSAAMAAARALQRVGGQFVVVHPSDLERRAHDATARLKDSVASLTALSAYCQALRVRLVVESPLPHLIGGNVAEFAALLDALDDSVGVCLDTGHAFLGRQWHRLVELAGTRLCHIHASDNRGDFDDHLPPGDGTIDWNEFRRSLDGAAYSGWVMLELVCPALAPGPFAARAADQALALHLGTT